MSSRIHCPCPLSFLSYCVNSCSTLASLEIAEDTVGMYGRSLSTLSRLACRIIPSCQRYLRRNLTKSKATASRVSFRRWKRCQYVYAVAFHTDWACMSHHTMLSTLSQTEFYQDGSYSTLSILEAPKTLPARTNDHFPRCQGLRLNLYYTVHVISQSFSQRQKLQHLEHP